MMYIQPQIDNVPKEFPLKANYKIMRLSPYQGNQFTLTNSQQQINFEIPRCVQNLSRSVFEFTINFPAAAVPATTVPFIPSDFVSFIQNIVVKTSQGQTLVNITEVDRLTKCTMAYMIDPYENSSQTGYMCPSYRTNNTNGDGGDCYFDLNSAFGATQLVPTSSISSPQKYNTNYDFPTHTLTPKAAAIYQKTFTIPMRVLLPDSIYSVDKDIFLDPINIQILFKPGQFWGFTATPIGGTTSSFNTTLIGANAITVSNLLMLIYQQADPEVQRMVMTTPQIMVIPYLFSQSTSFNTGGTQTTNFKIIAPSSNPKNRVLKIYYLLSIPDLTNNATTLCNSSNVGTFPANNDLFSNPKIFSQVQNYINGDLNLNLLNFWDVAAHALSCHEHSFKGPEDFIMNSCVPTVFTTKKCGRIYDGETMEGLPLNQNQFDVSHNFQIAPSFGVAGAVIPIFHHMFSVTLVECLVENGIFRYL